MLLGEWAFGIVYEIVQASPLQLLGFDAVVKQHLPKLCRTGSTAHLVFNYIGGLEVERDVAPDVRTFFVSFEYSL